jgi:hypothetical protein
MDRVFLGFPDTLLVFINTLNLPNTLNAISQRPQIEKKRTSFVVVSI